MLTKLSDYFRTHRMFASRVVGWAGAAVLLVGETAWRHTWIETATFFAGVMLVGISTIGRLWCSMYISGHKNELLTTVGPYSLTRNPLYLFSAIGFVGLALVTKTLIAPLLVAVLLAAFTAPVIAQEERHLTATFGATFADYCARTPRFWPRLSGLVEPETWAVNPRIFRRRLGDTLLFIWGVGFIELIDALHRMGVLPTLIRLY